MLVEFTSLKIVKRIDEVVARFSRVKDELVDEGSDNATGERTNPVDLRKGRIKRIKGKLAKVCNMRRGTLYC